MRVAVCRCSRMHWRAAQRTTTRTRRCRYCPGGRTMVPSTSASSAIVPCPRVIRWRPAWRWMSTVSIKRESIGEAWQGVTEVWVSGVWGQTALKSREWNGAKNWKRPNQKKKQKNTCRRIYDLTDDLIRSGFLLLLWPAALFALV